MKNRPLLRQALAILLALAAALSLFGCAGSDRLKISDLQETVEVDFFHPLGGSSLWQNENAWYYSYSPYGLYGTGQGSVVAEADRNQVVRTVTILDDELDPEYLQNIDKDTAEAYRTAVGEGKSGGYSVMEAETLAFFCDCVILTQKCAKLEYDDALSLVQSAMTEAQTRNGWEFLCLTDDASATFTAARKEK